MRLKKTQDHDKGEVCYFLTISTIEIADTKFDEFDRALLNDTINNKKSSISDILLGLEMLTRRISEQQNKIKEKDNAKQCASFLLQWFSW